MVAKATVQAKNFILFEAETGKELKSGGES